MSNSNLLSQDAYFEVLFESVKLRNSLFNATDITGIIETKIH